MVSKIGPPVTDPAMIHIRLAVMDGIPVTQFKQRALEIATDHLEHVPLLVEDIIGGKIELC